MTGVYFGAHDAYGYDPDTYTDTLALALFSSAQIAEIEAAAVGDTFTMTLVATYEILLWDRWTDAYLNTWFYDTGTVQAAITILSATPATDLPAVPLPASLPLLTGGLACTAALARRKRKAA